MKNNERNQAINLWARNKYLVLSKSHKIYLKIREYLKSDSISVLEVEKLIKEAIYLKESPKM